MTDLDDLDARVLLALVARGHATSTTLAWHVGAGRQRVLRSLERLAHRDLVASAPNRKGTYHALVQRVDVEGL